MTIALSVLAAFLGVALYRLLVVLQRRRVPTWLRHPLRAAKAIEPRSILVTGATGFIGREWCRRRIERGDRLIVLTRDAARAFDFFGPHVERVTSLAQIPSDVRIDAIVNLAGARIIGVPWTARRRAVLLASRLQITNDIVDLIARLQSKPSALVSMSAIGYYGVRGDEELTEADRGRPVFQSHVCQAWELAAQRAEQYGVRVVRLRSGVVLGRSGGALPELALSARLRCAVTMGSGMQWQSWIHLEDLLRFIDRGIADSAWSGAFNATAPVPVTQREFSTTLAARFGRALHLRVPDVALRLVFGEMAQLLADGQRVLPFKARCHGFEFTHPTLERALESLYPRKPRAAPAQILYDPGCPICDLEMRRYCGDATRTGLHWRFADVAASPEVMEQCRIDSQTARRRMYLIDTDGRMLSGIDALISIWAALPRWRWLATFIALPIVRSVANLLYDLVIAPVIWRWSTLRRARGLNRAALSGS